MNVTLKQYTDFAKACAVYETLKSFFYAYSIVGCDEHEL